MMSNLNSIILEGKVVDYSFDDNYFHFTVETNRFENQPDGSVEKQTVSIRVLKKMAKDQSINDSIKYRFSLSPTNSLRAVGRLANSDGLCVIAEHVEWKHTGGAE